MELNKYIDHTILKADATPSDIEKLCAEAVAHSFAAVCVNSCYCALAARLLEGSEVALACVVGFPLGAMATEVKAAEAAYCAVNGATEIDMVINIGAAKSGAFDEVERDIAAVVNAVRGRADVKVIIETCLLTDDEKIAACRVAVRAGAAFVKTSTGFSTGGATLHDVALMRRTVGNACKVKASGGIRDRAAALAMVEAGADRIGTSGGISICST